MTTLADVIRGEEQQLLLSLFCRSSIQLCASIPHKLSLLAGPGTGFHLAFGNMSFSSGPDTKVPTTRVRGGDEGGVVMERSGQSGYKVLQGLGRLLEEV